MSGYAVAPEPTAGTRVPRRIRRRQLAALFGCSLVIWTLGNGALPLLPVYAKTLGADDVAVGLYFAIIYAAIAIGTMSAGLLTDRVGHRKGLVLLSGVLMAPLTMAAGQTSNFGVLVALSAPVWFLAGIELALLAILTGLSAGREERGKVFGILALTGALGAVLGGATVGPIGDRLGYAGMFLVLGGGWFLAPLIGLFIEEPADVRRVRGEAASHRGTRPHPRLFYLLVAANSLAAVGVFVGILGRSFEMKALLFPLSAITSTVAVAGLVTLPVAPLLGTLSDRRGRAGYLGLCYAATAAGLVVYAGATSLGSFWIASALTAFVAYASAGVGSALVADLVPPETFGRRMATFNATTWIGAVAGSLATGVAFRVLGSMDSFLLGASLVLLALAMLVPIATGTWTSGTAERSAELVPDREGPP